MNKNVETVTERLTDQQSNINKSKAQNIQKLKIYLREQSRKNR